MPAKLGRNKWGKLQEKKVFAVDSSFQLLADKAQGDSDQFEDDTDAGLYTVEEQLDLPEEELNKGVTVILKADDEFVKEDLVEFSFKDSEYKPLSRSSEVLSLFSQRGTMILKKIRDAVEGHEMADVKRKNKFNFCDRACQTMNLALRDEELQTDMPPASKCSANATLWAITSLYNKTRNKESDEEVQPTLEDRISDKMLQPQSNENNYEISLLVAKQTERMVNQNRFHDVILDYGFYDNPCDEFMEQGLGSLLPLWKFVFKNMKKMPVTGISWNHQHNDMFAASYGINKMLSEDQGYICIYSLKCPSYVERAYCLDIPVQCVDFCKTCPYLLAAGFGDGTVAVYDLRLKEDSALASSQQSDVQHNDMVSQVRWLSHNVEKRNNFCSISVDGRVINWSVSGKELLPQEVIVLQSKEPVASGLEGSPLYSVSGGTSVSFNDDSMEMFLVGTQQGVIHKCSSLYSYKYLQTYDDHSQVVYNVEWNHYHPRVFLSCSADWTVRIWDHAVAETVFMFDMFCEVKAASWAPFSSTLFAAVTKDGKVHVFDLMMNRQQPTCTYSVYGPKKNINLTFVSFNPTTPVLIVGDDRGAVISFKLSPNLRASLKSLTEMERTKFVESEIDKMEKVLKLASSPGEIQSSS